MQTKYDIGQKFYHAINTSAVEAVITKIEITIEDGKPHIVYHLHFHYIHSAYRDIVAEEYLKKRYFDTEEECKIDIINRVING